MKQPKVARIKSADRVRDSVTWNETEISVAHPAGRTATPLHIQVAQKLATEIFQRRRRPGDILPSEQEMSQSLSLSRSAVREAIRILVAKGLVEPRPKRGTCITEKTEWNLLDPDVLAWMFASGPDEELVRNLFELRLILEPAVAALAASRRTVGHLSKMFTALDVMDKETLSSEAGRQADKDFHAALMTAAGNDQLSSLNATIGASIALSTRYKLEHNVLGDDPVLAHRAVYEAIESGDVDEARWRMESLIRQAMKDIVKRPARNS
ncbi:MAG: FadR/GntR family transcriptional regulator [Asticcacaulis sp.]